MARYMGDVNRSVSSFRPQGAACGESVRGRRAEADSSVVASRTRGGCSSLLALALLAVADADMQNCSWKPGDNGTQCLSTANFGASCLTSEFYSALRPRFCHMIRYPIYLGKGGAGLQDVQALDDEARKFFLTALAAMQAGCCREIYRAHVCAQIFPRCWVDDKGIVNRMPPCRNWLCNAYQERSDVEKRIAGFLGKPCFTALSQVDPLCEGRMDYLQIGDVEADSNAPNCTCPLNNVTKDKDCTPFRYLVTWEDLAMLGQEPNQVVCEDHTPGIAAASTMTRLALPHILGGAACAVVVSWSLLAAFL